MASDIPPYAVAAGNPCRVIKKRFDEDFIAYLLDLKWWDWDLEKIEANFEALSGGDLSLIRMIANHLYGPSYVSLHWALRWYGLIHERVEAVTAVTTRHTREFENSLGLFTFRGGVPGLFPHLQKADSGFQWKGAHKGRILSALKEHLSSTDIDLVKQDVKRFLRTDLHSLDIWSKDHFLQLAEMIVYKE